MQIAVDENKKGIPLQTDSYGNLKVVITDGSAGGSETTLNASVHTVGTTATNININKKVTTIDIANYSDTANVTLTIDNTQYVIGNGIATTLIINKNVTSISLVSTEADTKVQLVIKGINENRTEPTYEFDFNQILEENFDYDEFKPQSGQNLSNLFEAIDAEQVATIIGNIPADETRHTFKVECSDTTIYGEVINVSENDIPAINVYTDNKNIKVSIVITDNETSDISVVTNEINI